MYEVVYYKQLERKWLKGKVRNLTMSEANRYWYILHALLDTKLIKIRKMN